MKKLFGTGIIATLVVVLAGGWAYANGNGNANTILFPYINSNPGNLSTIINVINTASQTDVCTKDGPPHMLHYRYMTKLITASNMDYCDESNFCRPTTKNDIVTFDVAGQIESGKAMFNDDTSYDKGFGAPYFDLPGAMGEICPQRGYLLVSHACGDCNDAEKRSVGDLDGEAMLLDIVSGAAWGYRAALSDLEDEDGGSYAFAGITYGGCNPIPGATTELMVENDDCSEPNQSMAKVALYPPNEFTTRFFVTPLVIGYDEAGANNDMTDVRKMWQKRTGVCLTTGSANGVFNRNEAVASKGQCVQVRCVGAIDLKSLVGSVIDAPAFCSQGGWAYLDLIDPKPPYDSDFDVDIESDVDHAAIVTKLQFGSPSFAGGSMINTADTIRTDRIEVGGWGSPNPPSPCLVD